MRSASSWLCFAFLFCFAATAAAQDRRAASLAYANLGEPFSRGPTAAADWGDGRAYFAIGQKACLFDRGSGALQTLADRTESVDSVVEWDAENLLAFQGDRFFWYSKTAQTFSFGGTLRDWGLPASWLSVDAGLLATPSAMLLFSNSGGQYLIVDPSSLRITGPFRLQDWPSWPNTWTSVDAAMHRADGFFLFFSGGEMLIWDPAAELFVGDGPLLLDGLPSAGGGVHLLRPGAPSTGTAGPRPPAPATPDPGQPPVVNPAESISFPWQELPLEISAALHYEPGTLLLFHPDGTAGFLDLPGSAAGSGSETDAKSATGSAGVSYQAVEDWDLEIDAALWLDTSTVLLFSGDSWTTLDPETAEASEEWRPITEWSLPEGWDYVDAAVRTDPTTLAFYRDSEVFYALPAVNQVAGPVALTEVGGWPEAWTDGCDAAFSSFDGRLYYLRGREVARFDLDPESFEWKLGQEPALYAQGFTADAGEPTAELATATVADAQDHLKLPWDAIPGGITATLGLGEENVLLFSGTASGILSLENGQYTASEAFPKPIDAGDWFDDGVLLLASGDQTWTVDLDKELQSDPAPISELGLSWSALDAVVQWTEDELLWISGSEYSLYDPAQDTATPAAPLSELGLSWPDGRVGEVEAAFNLGAGGLYFVRDGQALLVDLASRTIAPVGAVAADPPEDEPGGEPQEEPEKEPEKEPESKLESPDIPESPDIKGVWTQVTTPTPKVVGDICKSLDVSVEPVPVVTVVETGPGDELLSWAAGELGIAEPTATCDGPVVFLHQDLADSEASPQPTVLCPDGQGGYASQAGGEILTLRSADSFTFQGADYSRRDRRRRSEPLAEDRFTQSVTLPLIPGGLAASARAYDLRTLDPSNLLSTGLNPPKQIFDRLHPGGGLDLGSSEFTPSDNFFIPWGLARERKSCSGGSSGSVEILNGTELTESLGSSVRSQVAFTSTNDYVKGEVQKMYSSKVSRFRAEARFVRHLMLLDVPNAYSLLSDEFRSAAADLAAGRLSASDFFERFGTHYPLAVAYGGASKKDTSLTSKDYSRRWIEATSADVNTQVDVSAQSHGIGVGGAGFGRGMGGSGGGQDATFASSVLREEQWEQLGGSCGHTVETCSSADSSGDHPVWIELRPVHQLLVPPFFTDPKIFGAARNQLAEAFGELFAGQAPSSWAEQAMPRYLPLSQSRGELKVDGTFYQTDPANGGKLVATVALKAEEVGLKVGAQIKMPSLPSWLGGTPPAMATREIAGPIFPRLAPNFYASADGDREYRFQSRYRGQLIERQSGRIYTLESCGLPLSQLSKSVQKRCGRKCPAPLDSVEVVGTVNITITQKALGHDESESFTGGECWCNGIDPSTQLLRCDHVTWTAGTRDCYDGAVTQKGLEFKLESRSGDEVADAIGVVLGQLGAASAGLCELNKGKNPTSGKVICSCQKL